jgi:hypothetical protein
MGLMTAMTTRWRSQSTCPLTTAEIRARLSEVQHDRERVRAEQATIAADALTDGPTADRWRQLDATAATLTATFALLTQALPLAEQREADAAATAAAERQARALAAFHVRTAEAQQWLDALLARLPTGDELTTARAFRDELHTAARDLSGCPDVAVRRPLDVLDVIVQALQHRLARIERMKHAHTITLGGSSALVHAAAARVKSLTEGQTA